MSKDINNSNNELDEKIDDLNDKLDEKIEELDDESDVEIIDLNEEDDKKVLNEDRKSNDDADNKKKLTRKERWEKYKKDSIEEFNSRTKKEHFMVLLFYFIAFAAILTFDEFVLRYVVSKGVVARNLIFLIFIPAEAAFFAMLCGFGKRPIISKIVFPLITAVITAYYIGQTLMYFNSQSIFSLALMGIGGDAVDNFGWAVPNAVARATTFIVLLVIPAIVSIVLSSIKKIKKIKGYPIWMHLCTLVAVVVLWVGGIGALKFGGTGRSTVYRLFFDTLADIDTTYDRFGALTTNIIELGTRWFGSGANSAGDIELVDKGTLLLEETPESEDVVTEVSDEVEVVAVVDEVVREPWVNDQIDFDALAASASNNDEKRMCEYLADREPTYTNEYTGMFEGYNLIYICAESFWTYACNEKVTPTLYKMANNGIVLDNYYNSFKNTTTNGEFAFNTSLWPDVSRVANCGTDVGSFAQSASKYMPQGLGDLAAAQGRETLAFHNYYGKYYRRILSWPNLGYKCKFMGQGMTFTTSWPASDLEMMQQSIPDYINSEEPFTAYYMTFSGHGPYCNTNCIYRKNINNVKFILGEDSDITEDTALGYLACNYELDQAMEYLLDELRRAGKLENTVIVIAGDHYPYYLSTEGRDELAGYTMDEDFDIYKSTCVIYNAGMEEPLNVDTYCSNVDILPTILNLFNIPYDSRLMAGTDIFDNRPQVVHKAALYNMSFITDKCKYNGATGEAIWSEEAEREYPVARRDAYIDAMVSELQNEYLMATQLVEMNFYKYIWYNSGLMSDDELAEELARESQVISQDEQYNAEDEAEKQRKEEEKAAKLAEEEAAAAAAAAAEQNANPEANPDAQVVPDTNTTPVDNTDATTPQ